MAKGRLDHKRTPRVVKALDLSTDKLKLYPSLNTASKATGVDPRRIFKIMTEGGQAGGYRFFSNDPDWVIRGKARRVIGNVSPAEFDHMKALIAWQGSTVNKFVSRAVRKEIEYIEAQRAEAEKALSKLEK